MNKYKSNDWYFTIAIIINILIITAIIQSNIITDISLMTTIILIITAISILEILVLDLIISIHNNLVLLNEER